MGESTTDSAAVRDQRTPQPPVPRTGKDGKPIYDQEFFLALARCGKDVWNRWRETNRAIRVTFGGTDFTKLDKSIHFAEYDFGNRADFSGSIFGDFASFSSAIFGDSPNLTGVTFGGRAKFDEAFFGLNANFSSATFGEHLDMSNAVFGDFADFAATKFGRGAKFAFATFGFDTKFPRTTFGLGVDFTGATFGPGAYFFKSVFCGAANFGGGTTSNPKLAYELNRVSARKQSWPQKQQEAFKELKERLQNFGAASDTFARISFPSARFIDVADFSGRQFKDRCQFVGARFEQPPAFDGCSDTSSLDLYGVKIRFSHSLQDGKFFGREIPGWTFDTDVALRLRKLRELAEETVNHDLERDLYIEERKAERGIYLDQYLEDETSTSNDRRYLWTRAFAPQFVIHGLWIAVMAAYSLLADYGRSFVRPLVALAVSVPLFWWLYSTTLIAPSKINTPAALQRTKAFEDGIWAFAISNAVPFVGALTLERDVKLTLLCGDRPIDKEHAKPGEAVCVPIPGRRFQLLALGQSIFSALCIFFAGLALRNYFKLR
jgi:hypothetical protein